LFFHSSFIAYNFLQNSLRKKICFWNTGFNTCINTAINAGINKGKAVPLQAWSGPEGCRKLRFPDFVTTAQDSSKVVSFTHRPPLPPGNTPGNHLC